MSRQVLMAVAAGLLLGVASGGAEAAVQTFKYSFDASHFYPAGSTWNNGIHYKEITGRFDVTYDPSVESRGILTNVTTNLPYSFHELSYYYELNKVQDHLYQNLHFSIRSASEKFEVGGDIEMMDGSLDDRRYLMYSNGEHGAFATRNVTFSVSSVPLPSSAPMFGAALLGLAGLGYAAKRKTAAAV